MTARPKLLDLFCCEGGAASGYAAVGFDVHGVDVDPAVRGRYLRSGAVSFAAGDATSYGLDDFDAVHASPPCKDHTDLASLSGGDGSGWMLPHTIARLRAWHARTGRPYVVENVVSASAKQHMDGALMLCGSMFGLAVDGYALKRHRLFLTSFPIMAPPDQHTGRPIVGVYGTGGGGRMTRGYKATPGQARRVMGMPWASRDGCAQAIPPAYAEYLGEAMMLQLQACRA